MHQSDVYAQGRELPPEAVAAWMHGFAEHVGGQRPLTVLDLGSGTGRFTPALAEKFGGPTYGVEPSERMRAIAEASARHPRVTYLAGTAEDIPLPDASCDLVLLFLSFHHVVDRDTAVHEIARVLRPGPAARVMVRSTFADRMPDLLWHRYFPRARVIEQEMFPTVEEVVSAFAVAGLHRVALDQVRQRFAPSLAEYAARLALRAISTFEHLNDDELRDGFAALNSDAAAEVEPRSVEADSDLLVLGRHPASASRATGRSVDTSQPR